MNSKEVIFISYDGMTDPLGQSQVLPYLKHLTLSGYKFHLISCEKKNNFQEHKNKISQICSESNISWYPLNYSGKIPVVSSFYNVLKINSQVKDICKKNDIKLIHARSYIPAIIALAFKRKHGIKFLFDMRGFWPDERVDGKLWNHKKFPFKQVYNYFKRKEIQFISEADHIISLTHNAKSEIESWGLRSDKQDEITVIPCCADLDHFNYKNVNTDKANQLRQDLNIRDNEFVLTYLGSIGTWYLLDEMLVFFKTLLKSKSEAKFLFITKDDPKLILEKAAQFKIPKESIRIQSSERENLPHLLSLTSASIFFITPAYSKKASSPTKMAELLGMGIPIICNDNVGDSNYFLNKENCGILLNELTDSNFQNGVDKVDEILRIPKNELLDFSKENFSLKMGANNYLKAYKSTIH